VTGTSTEAAPARPSSPADIGLWKQCAFQSVRVALWLLTKVLTLNGLYRFAAFFGTLEWCINYKRRRVFAQRLERVFGNVLSRSRRRRETLGHFRISRCDKVLYLIMDLLPRASVLGRFHIGNRELLDQGLAGGNGVYVALSHHGAHHVAGLCLALLGYRVAGVRDRKEGAMRRFIQQRYERKYPEFRKIRMIFSDAYPRDIYRCLKDNYTLGSALDVHRPRGRHQKTVPVTIFKEQRNFLTGTLQVALRSGSAVLQGFIVSEPGFHYRLELLGPLVASGDRGETPELLADVMQAYAENIESYARRHPTHLTRM